MKVIGITQCDSGYDNYPNWIKASGEEVKIINLFYKHGNIIDVEKCDGIVLSGGVDVHPKYYHNNKLDYAGAPAGFNEQRDEFEIEVLKRAQARELPVLAICRGMQLVNCVLGGDLIQDLGKAGNEVHKKTSEDKRHPLKVERDSLLYLVSGRESGEINSAHHQAAGVLADELMLSAVSPDGIAEAAEYKDKTGKPFFLCVQWHPERLQINNDTLPFTQNIRESFLASIRK